MGKRILLVDDDPLVIKIVKKIIETTDYEAEFCADGLEALVKLKDGSIDLVILDIMMPEINGYDVCYQLRFNDEYKPIPVVLLTVRDKELPDELSNRSDIAYVHKPINVKLLADTIDNFLND